MIAAGMVTHTSIPDFLNMTISRFFSVYSSIFSVLEKRNKG